MPCWCLSTINPSLVLVDFIDPISLVSLPLENITLYTHLDPISLRFKSLYPRLKVHFLPIYRVFSFIQTIKERLANVLGRVSFSTTRRQSGGGVCHVLVRCGAQGLCTWVAPPFLFLQELNLQWRCGVVGLHQKKHTNLWIFVHCQK